MSSPAGAFVASERNARVSGRVAASAPTGFGGPFLALHCRWTMVDAPFLAATSGSNFTSFDGTPGVCNLPADPHTVQFTGAAAQYRCNLGVVADLELSEDESTWYDVGRTAADYTLNPWGFVLADDFGPKLFTDVNLVDHFIGLGYAGNVVKVVVDALPFVDVAVYNWPSCAYYADADYLSFLGTYQLSAEGRFGFSDFRLHRHASASNDPAQNYAAGTTDLSTGVAYPFTTIGSITMTRSGSTYPPQYDAWGIGAAARPPLVSWTVKHRADVYLGAAPLPTPP